MSFVADTEATPYAALANPVGAQSIFVVAGFDAQGNRTWSQHLERPPFEIGDQYFGPELETWQMRPITVTDMVPRFSYRPGTWLLRRVWPRLNIAIFVLVQPEASDRRNEPDAILNAMSILQLAGNPYAHHAAQLDCRAQGMAPLAPPPWPFDVAHRTILFA